MFVGPIPLLFDECHAVFVDDIVCMPLDASDRSLPLEKAEGILQSLGVSALSRGRVQISICQGSFEFAVPNLVLRGILHTLCPGLLSCSPFAPRQADSLRPLL